MILKITGKSGEMIRVYCLSNGNYTNEWRHWDDPELREFLYKKATEENKLKVYTKEFTLTHDN